MEAIKRSEFKQVFWDETIESFNELIKEANSLPVTIKQPDVISRILSKFENLDDLELRVKRDAIFKTHQLDIENFYREAGWKVEYDKPGYNESYDAFWTFK